MIGFVVVCHHVMGFEDATSLYLDNAIAVIWT